MSRGVEEEARYRSHHYPDSQVLRNKLGITDQADLDVKEARAVELASVTRPKFKDFSLAEFQAVHKHLLGSVYSWAGEVRDYTTGRGAAPFARPEMIEPYFDSAVRKGLQKENFLRGMSPDEFAARSAHYVSETNAVHPFIDGNGRVTRLLLQDLAEQAGYRLNMVAIERQKDEWHAAAKLSFERGDTSKLEPMIRQAMTPLEKDRVSAAERPARAIAFEQRTQADALKAHPELAGAYKTLTAATSFARSLGNKDDQARFVVETRASIQTTLETGKVPPPPPMRQRDQGRER
jgi:cell filamentation protein